MRKLSIVIICFIPTFFFGQVLSNPEQPKRNTVYVEVFGQGLYNSLSFDRLYHLDKKIRTSFSAGLTVIPHPELFVLGAPVSYNCILGKKSHHLEVGIGFTAMYMRQGRISASISYVDDKGVQHTNYFVGHSNDLYTFFTPKVGYRFQKPQGGIFLRLTFSPPVAGINRIGAIKGGNYDGSRSYTEYFRSAAFFGPRIFPWAGISVGWTLQNKT